MRTEYTKYHRETGVIVFTGLTLMPLARFATLQGDEFGIYPGKYPDKYYHFVNDAPVKRLPHPASINKTELLADTVDAVTISGIPAKTYARISGTGVAMATYDIDDGELVYSTATPGARTIELHSFPFLKAEFHFNAR